MLKQLFFYQLFSCLKISKWTVVHFGTVFVREKSCEKLLFNTIWAYIQFNTIETKEKDQYPDPVSFVRKKRYILSTYI